MGAVYAGIHRNGHAVAVKLLHERLSTDPEADARFRREAVLANRVEHPAVVPVLDDDVAEDGCSFLVMPLLSGETVRARAARNGGRLAVEEVFAIASTVLRALVVAHERRVVHRDIKPENLFVTSQGEVRLLDFGIARLSDTTDLATATRSGRAIGTPAFMAPEQALGRSREVDGRTDLWALGATMFTLLTGRLVHVAQSGSETLILAATRPAPPLASVVPQLPSELAGVVDRALAFDQQTRWSDAASMSSALDAACAAVLGTPLSTLPTLAMPAAEEVDIHGAQTERPIDPFVESLQGAESLRSGTSSKALPVTRTLRTATHRRRFLSSAAAVAALLVAASGAALGVWKKRASWSPPQSPTNQALEKDLRLAREDWLAGQPDAVRRDAKAALDIDDSSAEARLDLVRIAGMWPDDTDRVNFIRAQAASTASKQDRAYLEALAPGMTIPADFQEQARRLEALHQQLPQDLPVSLALAKALQRVNRGKQAVGTLRPLAEAPDASAIVLAAYGFALADSDDLEDAVPILERCAADFPAAAGCLEQLSQIELLEGRCKDAERVARRELAADKDSTDGYFKLAMALDGQRVPEGEVAQVLDRAVQTKDPTSRPLYRASVDELLALVDGRFQDAVDLDATVGAATAPIPTDPEHFAFTTFTMELKAELGRPEEAMRALRAYELQRQVLQRDTYGGDNITYLQAIAASLHVLPWADWLPLRDARLGRHEDRDDLQDARQRTWMDYFAIPAFDQRTAVEAVAAMPPGLGFLKRSVRWPLHDAAIGNTLSLSGHLSEATPYFQRAVGSCMRLDDPIEYMHGVYQFAAHLERDHHHREACDAYRQILQTWSADSGSVTASEAAARVEARCIDDKRASNGTLHNDTH